MANIENFRKKQQTKKLRINRYFSEEFKKKKVREIEKNISTIGSISKEYEVSRSAIYLWVHKYSANMKKGVKQVVEAKSDTAKIQQLKEQIKELERNVGQKQIIIEFQQKMIELAEEEFGLEIKKKLGSAPSSGIGPTGKNILSK